MAALIRSFVLLNCAVCAARTRANEASVGTFNTFLFRSAPGFQERKELLVKRVSNGFWIGVHRYKQTVRAVHDYRTPICMVIRVGRIMLENLPIILFPYSLNFALLFPS